METVVSSSCAEETHSFASLCRPALWRRRDLLLPRRLAHREQEPLAAFFAKERSQPDYLQLAGRYLAAIVPPHTQLTWAFAPIVPVSTIVLPVIEESPWAVAVTTPSVALVCE